MKKKSYDRRTGLAYAQTGARFVVDRHQRVLRWDDRSWGALAGRHGQPSGRHCYDIVRGTDAAGRPLCGPRCAGWRALRDGHLVGRTRLSLRAERGDWVRATCELTALPSVSGGALGRLYSPAGSSSHAAASGDQAVAADQHLVDDLAAIGALAASPDHLSLPNNLERSLRFLQDATGAEAAEIFVTEPDGRSVVLTSYRGPFRRAFFEISRFKQGEGYPGLIMARGEPIVTGDLAHDDRYLRTAVKHKGFQAYVGVPCQGSGTALGSLHVAFRTGGADLARALQVLTWASRPIGTSLRSAMLELGASARRSLAETRHCGEQSFSALVSGVLGHLVASSGAESGSLILFGAASRGANLHVRHGAAPLGPCAAIDEPGGIGCPAVCEQRAVVRAGPRESWPAHCQGGPRGGAICYCIPLLTDGRPVGMAQVFLPRLQKWTPAWGLLAAELTARAGNDVIRDAWREAELQRTLRALGGPLPPAAPPAMCGAWGSETPTRVSTRQAAGAARLDIRCLGHFELWLDGAPVNSSSLHRKKALTLLKLLLAHQGRPVAKDSLIEALWPDSDPTRRTGQLYVLVHELRELLEPRGKAVDSIFIQNDNHGYRLDLDGSCTVDAVDFQALVARARRAEAARDDSAAIGAFEAAALLYRGDYMDDEPYAEWCWQEREHLREVCLDALQRLATLLGAAGNWARSVSHLQHALRIDRFREAVHRDLMFSLWAGGWRDQAIRQYGICRQLLDEELGVAPTRDTQRLLQRIRNSPRA